MRSESIFPMATLAIGETIMEMPETEPTITKRQVWNAGRTVDAKRALKPKQYGRSDSTSISAAACEIGRSLTSRSTANSAVATSFR